MPKMPEGTVMQRLAQLLFFSALMVFAGYFSDSPAYQLLESGQTELKLVVRHSGNIIGECRALDTGEIAALAPNMRRPMVCPREKAPMRVELDLNNKREFTETITPSGLHDDGVLALFRKFTLDSGDLILHLRITENPDAGGLPRDYEKQFQVDAHSTLIVEYTDSGFSSWQPQHSPRPRL